MFSQTTRMPNGLTNAAPWQTMGDAGMPDLTWAYFVFDDFLAYTANFPWALSGVGTPTATLVAGEGGQLALATSAAANDTVVLGRSVGQFKISSAAGNPKNTYFKIQYSVDNATLDTINAGLFSGTPLTPTEGVWIGKATGVNTFTLNHITGGVTTSVAFPAVCTLTAATMVELGFEIDATGTISAYWNPTTGSNVINPATGPRGAVCSIKPPALSTTLMFAGVAMLTSTAAARTLNLDYLFASKDR